MFKQSLEEFCSETTLHGVQFMIRPDSRKIKKCMWTLVVLSMLTTFLYSGTTYVIQYYKFESLVSVLPQAQASLRLPEVTVCNLNVVKNSSLESLTPVYKNLLTELTFLFVSQQLHDPFAYDIPVALKLLKFNDLSRYFSPTVEDIFVECRVAKTLVDCSKSTRQVATDKGFCFTFHADEFIHAASRYSSISLLLDVNPDDYVLPFDLGTGFSVLVHDPDVYPSMNEKHFAVAPGTDVFVALTRVVTKVLPRPYSLVDCIDKQDIGKHQNLSLGSTYSQDGCLAKCFQRMISCYGCNLLEPGPEACTQYSYFNCSLYKYEEYYKNGLQCENNCLPTCETASFQQHLSHQAFPHRSIEYMAKIKRWPADTYSEIKKRYVQVNVYFADMVEVQVTQVPSVTLASFVGDMGGQLGLFLGASLISLVEILVFIGNYLTKTCQKK